MNEIDVLNILLKFASKSYLAFSEILITEMFTDLYFDKMFVEISRRKKTGVMS